MSREIRIGQWLLQPDLLQLTGPTASVHLEPRSLAVLLDLARHGGEVRSRRQLLDAVWGGAAVGESALTHCIWELRSAFDDDARRPKFIQTVPRQGYRLIAPVSLANPETREGGGSDSGNGRGTLDWRPAVGLRAPGRPHWQLDRRLGRGGFGETWLVRHDKTGEPRVFKFCEQARLQHLKREITLFLLLKETLGERRDITRILDWDFDRPPYFIESQYTAGGNLGEWAESQGGLARVPLSARLELVAQVAFALAAAHSVGVLHKDVKPGNVLICIADGEAQAQLSDFGIGLITDHERLAEADITVLGWTEDSSSVSSHAGTPLYLAPELLEGKPSTVQADVYALGVLLYQIVRADFSRALAPGWREEVREALAETRDPALRGPAVGEILAEDIAAAVHGAPERRLRDAEELGRRLRHLGERGRKRAADRRAAERTARWRRRRRGMAWAVAVLGLLCVSLAVMSLRVNQEAAKARIMSDLLADMIERGDPFSPWLAGESQAEASAATSVVHRILSDGVGRLPELADQPQVRARLTHTFGRAFLHLGHYDRAASLLEQALALQAGPGGEAAASREITLDLAAVLREQGRYASAEELYREVRATLREPAFGGELEATAQVLSGLASTRQSQGDLDEAEALFRRALETRQRIFEPGHHEIGNSVNNLAGVLQARGDLAAAEPLYRQALEILRASLGDEHPAVADIFNNLAGVLQAQGRLADAEPLHRRALRVRLDTLGPSHSLVADSLNNLAWLRVSRGEPQAAEEMIQDALAIYRRALPADHWRIPNAESILAATFSERGRYAEAEDLLLASYPQILAGTGERSQYTRDVLSRLIRLYELWDKPLEAAALAERRRASGGMETTPSAVGAGHSTF